MGNSTKRYPKDFKNEAVKLALNSPSVNGTAKELGIPEATLNTWVKKAKHYGEDVKPPAMEPINVGELISENRELKKQLARLEQEKAILKKAATYFAKELG